MALDRSRSLSGGLLGAVAVATALAAGCVATDWSLLKRGEKLPAVCQTAATWQNSVLYTPDPANQGKMSPGLAGRVYLFGPELGDPLVGDGGLQAEVYDETAGKPQLVDRWEIDAATLKRLLKRDRIGWGYTVYLPLVRYRAEMAKVRIRLAYQPAGGSAIFTENQVSLAPMNGAISVQQAPR